MVRVLCCVIIKERQDLCSMSIIGYASAEIGQLKQVIIGILKISSESSMNSLYFHAI